MDTAPKEPLEMATTPGQKRVPEVNFRLPAGKSVKTLKEQADFFMDTYRPDWKEKGHIIPVMFNFKHKEFSDAAVAASNVQQSCAASAGATTSKRPRLQQDPQQHHNQQNEKKKGKQTLTKNLDDIKKDRRSDNAEAIVYDAIAQLIEDNFKGPFAAVRNVVLELNYDKSKKETTGLWTKILSTITQAQWSDYRSEKLFGQQKAEFDFVLIGPEIGIIVIEVKSADWFLCARSRCSSCCKRGEKVCTHYSDRKVDPHDYEYGVLQLEKSNAMLWLLEKYTEVALPVGTPIRKILFTPNFQKPQGNRYIFQGVTQWFKEETTSLSDALRRLIEEDHSEPGIDVYIKYAPIIAAMATMKMLPAGQLDLDLNKFSNFHAAVAESLAVMSQNVAGKKLVECQKFLKVPLDREGHKKREAFNIFSLNDDQLNAVNSNEERLIINGSAGTGKTIVLQAKALALLGEKKSVNVFTPNCFYEEYIKLFQSCGYTNYKIKKADRTYWSFAKVVMQRRFVNQSVISMIRESWTANYITMWLENILKVFEKPPRELNFLEESDAIIIDDAADDLTPERSCKHLEAYFLTLLLTMAFCNKFYKDKVMWMAVDLAVEGLYFKQDERRSKKPSLLDILCQFLDLPQQERFCHVAKLREVMRCSGNIYNAYKSDIGLSDEITLGHKIPGFNVNRQTKHFAKSGEALLYDRS